MQVAVIECNVDREFVDRLRLVEWGPWGAADAVSNMDIMVTRARMADVAADSGGLDLSWMIPSLEGPAMAASELFHHGHNEYEKILEIYRDDFLPQIYKFGQDLWPAAYDEANRHSKITGEWGWKWRWKIDPWLERRRFRGVGIDLSSL